MSEKRLSICICGGGNMGHALTGLLGSRTDLDVYVLTRRAELWQSEIVVTLNNGERIIGVPKIITNNPEEVIPISDIIFVTVPSFGMYEVLQSIAPFVRTTAWVGALPGTGGFDWMFKDVLGKDYRMFGLQRVPYICRTKTYGEEVNVSGIKDKLFVAALPNNEVQQISGMLEHVFQVPLVALNNYLEVTMTTSNPILHPSRLYGLFHDWVEGMYWPEQILFYESWDMLSSETLLGCDAEVQRLCTEIPLDLSAVLPLTRHYGVENAREMTRKLSSIVAFKGILTPMLKTAQGFKPDFASRYFSEDIAYGLVILRGIAELAKCPTPTIDRVLEWSQQAMGKEYLVEGRLVGKDIRETAIPQCFGINTLEELIAQATR